MEYLVFDIETSALPFEGFDETQQEFLLRGCATDDDRRRQKELMSLNPLTAQVVSIGMLQFPSLDAEPTACVYSTGDEPFDGKLDDGATWRVRSEREVLERWWKVIEHGEKNGGWCLISFNGRAFDAPFLMLRSAALRVKPTRNMMQGTRWNYPRHTDLADELSFYSHERTGPMRRFNFDFYCRAFGITSPKSEGINGYQVPEFFRQGRHREIAEYCLRDVHATWELFRVWKEYLSMEGTGGRWVQEPAEGYTVQGE
jgi:DNA polymerase elongation subunit (family B)